MRQLGSLNLTRLVSYHIYTNVSLPSTSGSIALEIADHLPVFTILYNLDQTPSPDKLEYRDFKRFDGGLFKTALSQVGGIETLILFKTKTKQVDFMLEK